MKPTMRRTVSRNSSPITVLGSNVVDTVSMINRGFGGNRVFIPRVLITTHTVGGNIRILGPRLTSNSANTLNGIVVTAISNSLRSVNGGLITVVVRDTKFRIVSLKISIPTTGVVRYCGRGPSIGVVTLSTLLAAAVPTLGRAIRTLGTTSFENGVGIVINKTPVARTFTRRVNTSKCSSSTTDTTSLTGGLTT